MWNSSFGRVFLIHCWHLVYSRVHFIASNFLTLAFKQMVCVCCVVLECEAVPKSTNLKKVVLDAGPANEGHLTVVTNASNIRVGTRTAVALVGSVVDDAGSEVTITKQVVKGVASEGMICDSLMLGWVGGAKGLCVQLPDSIALGDPAPTTKPRVGGAPLAVEEEAAPGPSKEDKKAAAAAKKAAMKEKLAAKRAAKAGGEEGGAAEKEKEEAEEQDAGAGLEKLAL